MPDQGSRKRLRDNDSGSKLDE